ncbi:MAG: hypothetical protein UZ21_OP11001000182 [Microgenomates bacterium OLB22]|nr:MAG: hypothetical protein UZ21_OP11001000182 [Microgenomates bacterium OLB22]
MVDIASVSETTEKQYPKIFEIVALGNLVEAVAEAVPSDEDLPTGELNHTPLRRALRDEGGARGWYFEHLINKAIRKSVEQSNQERPGLCDAKPVRDGIYGRVTVRTNSLGGLVAYRTGVVDRLTGRPITLAEYDGLVRIGSKLIIVETKMTKKLPSKFNIEGKVKTLQAIFPDMDISCLVVLQPQTQQTTTVTEVNTARGSFTLIRRASELGTEVGEMAGRIHVMANSPPQLAPA